MAKLINQLKDAQRKLEKTRAVLKVRERELSELCTLVSTLTGGAVRATTSSSLLEAYTQAYACVHAAGYEMGYVDGMVKGRLQQKQKTRLNSRFSRLRKSFGGAIEQHA